VVDVDFTSVESLAEPLKGQDAIVSTVAAVAIPLQKNMIDAAIIARVKRFVPSEYGSDLDNKHTRQNPVFAEKVKIQEYLMEKAKSSDLTYTFVYNGPFLDWGLEQDFILEISDYKPVLFDGGEQTFCTTSLATASQATVALLERFEETKNRAIYIEDIKTSQKQLYELAKQAAPGEPWDVSYRDLDALRDETLARLSQGVFDRETIVGLLKQSIFRKECGGSFKKTDNELLGLKGKTEDDVVEILQKLLR
jgi:hypothetical protein